MKFCMQRGACQRETDVDSMLCRKKKAAARRILGRVAEAFGVMMLDKGLFQADAHPGNILVMKGVLLLRISSLSLRDWRVTMSGSQAVPGRHAHHQFSCLY